MNILLYIFISSVCLSIFFTVYKLMFRNESNFSQLRLYLLASIIISLILPSTSISINVDFLKNLFTPEAQSLVNVIKENSIVTSSNLNIDNTPNQASVDWLTLFIGLYYTVSIALITRIMVQLFTMIILYYRSERVRMGKYVIVTNSRNNNTFSFFRWIFINTKISSADDIDQIISHEKIHASQYHSIDLILVELLAAVMWFNPLIWMMRSSIQLVHEYLADEGALSTGIDRLKYQALLLNQVAEERLVCLSSNFNHSLIKKRMIMMTKSKFNHGTKLRILTLLPVSAFAFIIIASINGLFPSTVQAGPIPLKETSLLEIKKANSLTAESDTIKKIKIIRSNKESNIIDLRPNGNESDSAKVIYVVDGVYTENIDNLDQNSIKSVNVQKKDNLVIIRTKDSEPSKDTIIFKNKVGVESSNIIYIIDGIEHLNQSDFKKIDPNTIEKVAVIKDKNQMKKYSKRDCDGIIIITTNKQNK